MSRIQTTVKQIETLMEESLLNNYQEFNLPDSIFIWLVHPVNRMELARMFLVHTSSFIIRHHIHPYHISCTIRGQKELKFTTLSGQSLRSTYNDTGSPKNASRRSSRTLHPCISLTLREHYFDLLYDGSFNVWAVICSKRI